MSHDSTLPPDDLTALESALRGLAPVPARLDRDALMFQAGRSTAPRPRAFGTLVWQVSTAALALVATVQATMLAHRHSPPYLAPTLAVHNGPPEPSKPREPSPTPRFSVNPNPLTPHQRLAHQLVRYGLDALPSSPMTVATTSDPSPVSPSASDLLRSEVDRILNPGDPS